MATGYFNFNQETFFEAKDNDFDLFSIAYSYFPVAYQTNFGTSFEFYFKYYYETGFLYSNSGEDLALSASVITVSLTPPGTAVPEPASLAILAAGVIAVGVVRKRQSKHAAA